MSLSMIKSKTTDEREEENHIDAVHSTALKLTIMKNI